MKVTDRFACLDTEPAVAKRQHMARVYDGESDQHLTASAEIQDSGIGLIVENSTPSSVSRRRFVRAKQIDGGKIAVDDASGNHLAMCVGTGGNPLKLGNRGPRRRIDPRNHRKWRLPFARDPRTPRR